MIGVPTTLTTSVQHSCNFGPSSPTNNDTENLQRVISEIRTRQKIIWEYSENIGHKDDACIIRYHTFLPPSHIIKMNQFNALHGDEPTDPPRECNSQPPENHFRSRTSPPKTSPVVSAITGILNHHCINNGGVEVHP